MFVFKKKKKIQDFPIRITLERTDIEPEARCETYFTYNITDSAARDY